MADQPVLPSTADLVKLAAAGDHAAFAALVDRFASLVWSVARAYRLDHSDAVDVHQTVWLRLVENLDRIREPAALAGWLVATARHEAERTSRHASRERPSEDAGGDAHLDRETAHQETPEDVAVRHDEHRAVRRAFDQLPERCRRMLRILAATDRPDYGDVAAALGMPRGSVGPTRQRCLDQLRHRLGSA